jgi:WD40 repeat protein
MSGEGHKDWVAGIDFHPKGSHLATCSGDSTIKIWDFLKAQCVHTFTDHIHPVWSVAFNDTGDFLISGSIDHTSKLFDIPAGKARGTFRGHVDSINHVQF